MTNMVSASEAGSTNGWLLLVETSGRCGQIGLARGSQIVASRTLAEARRHARDLVPAIGELLSGASIGPRDMAAVVASRGPGSYTGLRVGVMAAKTFAYATGCRLLAIDTFLAIAYGLPHGVEFVDIIADAQQAKIYVQQFARGAQANTWQAADNLRIVRFVDWLASRRPEVMVCGPGLHLHAGQFQGAVPLADPACWDPGAEGLLRAAWPRLVAGDRDDIYAVEPLYLRPSSAEEKWAARS